MSKCDKRIKVKCGSRVIVVGLNVYIIGKSDISSAFFTISPLNRSLCTRSEIHQTACPNQPSLFSDLYAL